MRHGILCGNLADLVEGGRKEVNPDLLQIWPELMYFPVLKYLCISDPALLLGAPSWSRTIMGGRESDLSQCLYRSSP